MIRAHSNARSTAIAYLAGGHDPVTNQAKRAFHVEAVRLGAPLHWNHADWKSTSCAGDPLRAWQAAGFPRPHTPTPPTEDDMPDTFIIKHPRGPVQTNGWRSWR